jgi:hypothetical protein
LVRISCGSRIFSPLAPHMGEQFLVHLWSLTRTGQDHNVRKKRIGAFAANCIRFALNVR